MVQFSVVLGILELGGTFGISSEDNRDKFYIHPDIEIKSDFYLPITMIWRALKTIFKGGSK
jgi:hypothetical protein